MAATSKRISLLLVCCLLAALTAGCWSRRELNEISVVLAMGIDSVGDQYEVTVQVADPFQMSRNRTTDRSPTTTFTQRESTLLEALRKITTTSSRRMYTAHMLFVVFDEETAKRGIIEPLDFLLRESDVRPDFTLAVVRNYKARDVMELVTPTEILPAMDLHKSLTVSERIWAPTSSVNVKDLLQMIAKDGIEPVLTGLILEGDIREGQTLGNARKPRPAGGFRYTGIGVFQGGRLKGWLNESDSKAYTYIANHLFTTVGSAKCPHSEDEFVIEVTRAQVGMHPTVVDRQPHMKLDVYMEGNVAELACRLDLTKENNLLALQRIGSDVLRQILTHGIQTAQNDYEADIFGFGESFHRRYPRYWAEWKDDWNSKFKTLPVEIKIDYRLNMTGKIINQIDKRTKE